jgi:hypothetical protein
MRKSPVVLFAAGTTGTCRHDTHGAADLTNGSPPDAILPAD